MSKKQQPKRLKTLFGGIIFAFLAFTVLPNDPLSKIEEALKTYMLTNPQEKAYLHLDKPYYMAGETIWFKAYLFDGIGHTIDSVSQVVYVDLYDPSVGKLVAQRRVQMKGGTGHGDIALPDSLAQGIYVIRAYTNYMRNFSEDVFFQKSLPVWQKSATASLPMDEKLGLLADCTFFPEGGNLLADFDNRIAFKAVSAAGRGVNVQGYILENGKDTVGGFQSLHLGMGYFQFKPKMGATYTAKVVQTDGKERSFDLPKAQNTGYMMTIDNLSNRNNIRISVVAKTLSQNPQDSLVVIGQQRGKMVFWAKMAANKPISRAAIAKNLIKDDGIVQVTLFDPQSTPQCERLIFAQTNGQINLSVKSDKPTYKQREKVTLTITATDSTGKPVAGNFSLSATDAQQVLRSKDEESILSYLLLSSDINGKDAVLRGGIESPASYFDKSGKMNASYLDILLMTQGWRRFKWEDILAGKFAATTAMPEQGFAVMGKVVRPNNKVSKNVSLTLMFKESSAKSPSLRMALADEKGDFSFNALTFFDTTLMFVQAVKERGGRNLDIKLEKSSSTPPSVAVTKIPFNTFVFDAAAFANFLKTTNEVLAFEKKLRDSKDKLLEEVVVKAKKTEAVDSRRIYNKPNSSIEIKPEDCGMFNTIFDAIQGRVAGVQVTQSMGQASVTIRGGTGVAYYLDGMQTDADMMQTLSPCDVEAIDVLKGTDASIFGVNGGDGVISVLTRRGNPTYDWSKEEALGVKLEKYVGYSTPREFYAPRYDVPIAEHEFPDFRATLHWQPYVRTDSTGVATVTFFNTDARVPVDVVVEGFSKTGRVGAARMRYEVK
jgi:TonB-dependent Receptor Plug Domain